MQHSEGRPPVGASVMEDGVVFCVWAPDHKRVDVMLYGEQVESHSLKPGRDGYFSGMVPGAAHGTLYKYRLDGENEYPDPGSRFQPEGPHGPSMVVDPKRYRWHDSSWQGVEIKGQVIYEVHIGTFTPEGTFDAAIDQLPALKETGITVLEVMPVAEFAGRWNWGYDGVDLYAPTHNYGDEEAFKRFVDACHREGLGVILDVVYNHLGPDGNYLSCFSKTYFTDKYETDWGAAVNFDGPGCHEVREYIVQNACYWISEFHLDGLRLDATQNIYDSSEPHILSELTSRIREEAGVRPLIVVGENEPQNVLNLAPVAKDGYGIDALWNDDFHHSAIVAFTGRHEGYYHDHRGTAQEFISAVKRGFLFQGQYYSWQEQPRGSAVTGEPASAFVIFTENHDQVANTLWGDRLLKMTSWSRYKALTALMLLAPETPMLFMGQEYGASQPFRFFVDHKKDLKGAIRDGRKEFLAQFTSFASAAARESMYDPNDPEAFFESKLDPAERAANTQILDFHKDLLRLRREDPVVAAQSRETLDGAVLTLHALVLRFFNREEGDRLLVMNLGQDLEYSPAAEPLLAPPDGMRWELVWTSDDPRYRGWGVVPPCSDKGWRLAGESAAFLKAVPSPAESKPARKRRK